MPSLSPATHLAAFACALVLAGGPACGRPEAPRLPEPPAAGWRADALKTYGADELSALLPQEGAREALVVALWAHWCDPCIEELPELTALADANPGWGVLSLVTDDLGSASTASRVQAVLDRVKPTHAQGRIAPGGEHRLLSSFGLEWEGILPKTFVLARGEPVRAFELHARTRDELVLEVKNRLRGASP
jgi:thiol-disulfide isomerase/thioredoxin